MMLLQSLSMSLLGSRRMMRTRRWVRNFQPRNRYIVKIQNLSIFLRDRCCMIRLLRLTTFRLDSLSRWRFLRTRRNRLPHNLCKKKRLRMSIYQRGNLCKKKILRMNIFLQDSRYMIQRRPMSIFPQRNQYMSQNQMLSIYLQNRSDMMWLQ